MRSKHILKLKCFEKHVVLLAKGLFCLFWLLAAMDLYGLLLAETQTELKHLFFSAFGGVFAVLFYLCIVYGAVLEIAKNRQGREENGFSHYITQAKKLGWILEVVIFTYAALDKVAQALAS